jgi:hypothetical protein
MEIKIQFAWVKASRCDKWQKKFCVVNSDNTVTE